MTKTKRKETNTVRLVLKKSETSHGTSDSKNGEQEDKAEQKNTKKIVSPCICNC